MNPPSDRWVTGSAYQAFMGRWSRQLADHFLGWLALPSGLNWLDVGCGTGAVSQAICALLRPGSLVGCDPSPDFVAFARDAVKTCPATFVVAGVDSLPRRETGFDVIVSGLVLNFLPEPHQAVRSMVDGVRPGGTVAAYVWDYADGMQFLRFFWEEAAATDPSAINLDEARRFPLCRTDRLADLWRQAGMTSVETTSLRIETVFSSFDDFWLPFRAGTGPGPSFVASLEEAAQESLALRLRNRLRSADGSIRLSARAFGVRGLRPGGPGSPAVERPA